MPGRHPCERGERCSCHRAGPSTPPRKKTAILAAAALVCPVLAAPTPTHLPFLYPTLDKRVTDAGQAPDDPSEGFTHQHIQLADLIRAGLPYKYVYDPSANVKQIEEELELKEEGGAWVIDNAWSLHGRRFGPLYATATAGITDDPLPTPTESIPPASTPTTTTTSPPTMLAIQSSLPTGWDSTQYERSDMYAIPLVVSFALVIALMIGSLIGALVIRRSKSRSRRRKKRIIQGDDDSAREKVAQSSLVSRVGRALRHRDQPDDSEEDPRTELEHRVKSWARRSAAWRVQARVGVRRRMGRGRKRSQADIQPGSISGAIQEDPEAEEREATRAPTPVQSRAPTPTPNAESAPSAAPNYSSPVVPTYSSSPDAGPSTPITRPEPRADPITRMEAHPDAAPSDEPAYDGPGAGQGLPPAYRGGGLSEVARGKRPAHTESESTPDPAPAASQTRDEPRVWTELDAYAFGQEGGREAVTAHVATDDKRVLERLHLMRGAPEGLEAEEEVHAPREEDVFGGPVTPGGSDPSSSAGAGEVPLSSSEAQVASPLPETSGGVLPSSGTGVLPLPPTKTGTGPVARYGEADLSLPRYLDGQEGISGPGMGMPSAPELETGIGLGVPSAPGGMEGLEGLVPSAPPCEEEMVLPSAPVLEDETPGPSAPLMDEDSVAFAPPMDGDSVASAPSLGDDSVASAPPLDDHPMTSSLNSVPSAPPLDDHSSASTSPSTPLHDDDALHPDDKTALRQPTPQLRRLNSSSPLLSEER